MNIVITSYAVMGAPPSYATSHFPFDLSSKKPPSHLNPSSGTAAPLLTDTDYFSSSRASVISLSISSAY